MEKENWIENIINSITSVAPDANLFSKIQHKIHQQQTVPVKTLWLVAASIAVLLLLNISVLDLKAKQTQSATTAYLEMTVNKSNQLYQ
jgi:hypothetical protein